MQDRDAGDNCEKPEIFLLNIAKASGCYLRYTPNGLGPFGSTQVRAPTKKLDVAKFCIAYCLAMFVVGLVLCQLAADISGIPFQCFKNAEEVIVRGAGTVTEFVQPVSHAKLVIAAQKELCIVCGITAFEDG